MPIKERTEFNGQYNTHNKEHKNIQRILNKMFKEKILNIN